MFTGLVEELGKIRQLRRGARSFQLTVAANLVLTDVKLGDSIAVNGICLTVVDFGPDWFTADVMPETVSRSVLCKLIPGDCVNLERSLKVGDRFGGHIVSGHVDGVGIILNKSQDDNAIIFQLKAHPDILKYIVVKGSIAIDGISLTVVSLGSDYFSVSVIPHSAAKTTLGLKKMGDIVNLETDIIGKYVERLLGQANGTASGKDISIQYLASHGFA